MFDNKFMSIALEMAQEAYANNEVPVGAVVVCKGEIIVAQRNRNIELSDPTAHAEILAIRDVGRYLERYNLLNCEIYVTLEPCQMCAQAISWSRICRLYYGAADLKCGGVENGARIFSTRSCTHRPEVYSGFREQECRAIMQDFFRRLR